MSPTEQNNKMVEKLTGTGLICPIQRDQSLFLKNTVVMEDEKKKDVVIEFWKSFYAGPVFEQYQDSMKKTKNALYKDKVIELLEDFKKTHSKPYREEDLEKLQLAIESFTILFDEESIHATCHHIMTKLIDPAKVNAKDFVLERLTSEQDKLIVSDMGQFTLEAIIVFVIGQLYNYNTETTMIRVSTLIDQLERHVKAQSHL